MDIQGPQVVTYVYSLVNGEVRPPPPSSPPKRPIDNRT